MKRILSINGGGIRGIIPAGILASIEQQTGQPAATTFDLIAGASTGGILAIGLGLGIPAIKLVSLYIDRGAEIFSKPWWRRLLPLSRARYGSEGLEKVLTDTFGAAKFGDSKTNLLIPTYDQKIMSPYHFKSWDSKDNTIEAVQVGLATSAAPTYFPASGVDDYVDGGLVANNPTMNAYAQALKLWPGESIQVLNLGTGFRTVPRRPIKDGGLGSWGPRLIDVLMSNAGADTKYMADACLGSSYVCIDAELPPSVNIGLDCVDPQNLKALLSLSVDLAAQKLPGLRFTA